MFLTLDLDLILGEGPVCPPGETASPVAPPWVYSFTEGQQRNPRLIGTNAGRVKGVTRGKESVRGAWRRGGDDRRVLRRPYPEPAHPQGLRQGRGRLRRLVLHALDDILARLILRQATFVGFLKVQPHMRRRSQKTR